MPLHFTASQSDLARELTLSIGAVERKGTIPILGNVRIASFGDRIQIQTSDLELSITTTIPAKVKSEGVITLPARKLTDYVRMLPGGEVSVKVGESFWATVSSGTAKCRIAGMSADSFPEIPVAPAAAKRLLIPATALVQLIKRTNYAISAEESRFTLNGALLEAEAGAVRMVATDSHRLALDECKVDGADGVRALFPRKAMAELVKAFEPKSDDVQVSIAMDDNNVYSESGDRSVVCRRMAGNFPDYRRVIPAELKHWALVSRLALLAAVGRVKSFADDRSRSTKWTITTSSLTVSAMTHDSGESEESVDCSASADLRVALNADYVMECCQAFTGDQVRIEYQSGGAALIFADGGKVGAAGFCVVMPMRIE